MPRLKKVKSIYKIDPKKRNDARKRRTRYLTKKGHSPKMWGG